MKEVCAGFKQPGAEVVSAIEKESAVRLTAVMGKNFFCM